MTGSSVSTNRMGLLLTMVKKSDSKPVALLPYIRAAQDGSQEAFSEIIRRVEPIGRAIAFSRTGDIDASVDLLQEAWLKAFEKLPGLRDPERFLPWFATLVSNLASDRARRRRTENAAQERLWQNSASRAAEPAGEETLLQLIQDLDTEPRALIVLRFMGNLSYKEIAELLDTPVNSVKWGIQQAFQELRDRLGERP